MLSLSSDLETICNIVRDVIPNLEENGAKVNNNELDMRMMIHQSQAGCVIGKAGCKIKEIREKIGARIKIFSNPAPQSTDRIIQIIGEPDKCIEAIREVLTLIKSSPIKGIINPYDPHNYDEYYADEYGGWGGSGNQDRRGGGASGGPRGAGPRNGPPMGGGRFNNRSGPPPPRPFINSNFNENRSPIGGGISQRRDPFERPALNGAAFDRNGWGGPQNNMSQPPPTSLPPALTSLSSQNGPGGKSTTQVTIPKDLAGAIIGKGGSRIRKIRLESGAGITIDEPLPGSNDRIITISGSANQIQMAQYLLQQSVHNNLDRNNY